MENIVENINAGVRINENYNQWLNIKTEKQHKEWVEKTSKVQFGYSHNILTLIEEFNPRRGYHYDEYIKSLKRVYE